MNDDDFEIEYDDDDVEKGEHDAVDDNELNINPDDEFEGQFGYVFVRILRGTSTGRQLKRDAFKLGLCQFFFGLVLLIIAAQGAENFQLTSVLEASPHRVGRFYRGTLWTVSILSFPLGLISLFLVRHWSTFTTNRVLVGNFFLAYTVLMFLIIALSIWCLCSLFMTFGDISWGSNVDAQSVRPFYTSTAVFLIPYVLFSLIYTMDVWYLTDEVFTGGVIVEPEGSAPPLMDLSGLTPDDSCFFCCALPFAACIQGVDCVNASMGLLWRCLFGEASNPCVYCGLCVIRDPASRKYAQDIEEEGENNKKAKKKKGFCYRLCKTLSRWTTSVCGLCFRFPKDVSPDPVTAQQFATPAHEKLDQRLKALREKRDKAERQQQQATLEEKEREEAEEAERRQREEEERARREEQELVRLQQQQAEELANQARDAKAADSSALAPTLSVQQFKALWSMLEAGGSFQCKLRAGPTMHDLSEHMRRQGFHVVFASTSGGSIAGGGLTSVAPTGAGDKDKAVAPDIELGICNVRESGMGPWFMARFIVSGSALTFSAVMKCEDDRAVPNFVKRFALAKVLKIDASGVGGVGGVGGGASAAGGAAPVVNAADVPQVHAANKI